MSVRKTLPVLLSTASPAGKSSPVSNRVFTVGVSMIEFCFESIAREMDFSIMSVQYTEFWLEFSNWMSKAGASWD